MLGGKGGGKFFSERMEEDLVPNLQERKLLGIKNLKI